MIQDASGVQVGWDHQIGTFIAQQNGQWIGKFSGDIPTVAELEVRLGVTLEASTRADLAEEQRARPYTPAPRTVTKLQFVALIRPADYDKIYDAKLGSSSISRQVTIAINQLLDQIGWASDNRVQLNAPETVRGLQGLEQMGYLTAGDAARIEQGLPWA